MGHPVDWAETQGNLAIASLDWAEHLSYRHANATRLRDKILTALDALPEG